MEAKFYIDTDQKTIIESFKGEISLRSVTEVIPHIWSHPDYSPSFDGIIDFRNSKLLFSKEELHNMIKTIAEDENGMRGRLAILVSEPMSAAMSTIYGEEMKKIHSVGIFCEESEVIHYLRISPNIFDQINNPEVITIDLK